VWLRAQPPVLAALGKVPMALLPFVLAGVGLIVSGPSLFLAFIKLRNGTSALYLTQTAGPSTPRPKSTFLRESLTAIAKLPGGATLDPATASRETRALAQVRCRCGLLIWIYSLLSVHRRSLPSHQGLDKSRSARRRQLQISYKCAIVHSSRPIHQAPRPNNLARTLWRLSRILTH